jgi:hypothetical protein
MKLILAGIVVFAAAVSSGVVEAAERGIVPVVGSTAGAFESVFRTELQMANRTAMRMTGWIVVRPAGAHGAGDVRTVPYLLEPRTTLRFADVVAELGLTGLASLEIRPLAGVLPTVVARAFDDQGEQGTSGANIPLIRVSAVPRQGDRTLLITPPDLEHFRFNIGLRTLDEGATVRFRVYGQSGIERYATVRSWAPEYFEQRPAAEMIGTTLLSNESIDVEILAGSAAFYGTTTDNRSNDPAVQVGPVTRVLAP